MKTLICCDCGREFEGKYAYYCPECRHKRKADSARMAHVREGAALKKKEKEKRVAAMLKEMEKKRHKEKLDTYDVCPNFDAEKVSCQTCPAGVWKFKGCGSENERI